MSGRGRTRQRIEGTTDSRELTKVWSKVSPNGSKCSKRRDTLDPGVDYPTVNAVSGLLGGFSNHSSSPERLDRVSANRKVAGLLSGKGTLEPATADRLELSPYPSNLPPRPSDLSGKDATSNPQLSVPRVADASPTLFGLGV